jgi:hypothetical protein
VSAKLSSNTSSQHRPHRSRAEIETLLCRRSEHFRVLTAIAEQCPNDLDIDGRASGTVSVAELAKRAGVSGKAVGRALKHWQQWRVLWIHWRREQIRFERPVVESLLAAWANDPRGLAFLLRKHRAKREAAAPWPRVPKTPCVEGPQVAETALGEKTN